MLKKTSSFWRSTPNGRKTAALTSEKIVVFAPMPSANVTMAAAVKPGRLRSRRNAKVRSWRSIMVAYREKRSVFNRMNHAHCPILGRAFRARSLGTRRRRQRKRNVTLLVQLLGELPVHQRERNMILLGVPAHPVQRIAVHPIRNRGQHRMVGQGDQKNGRLVVGRLRRGRRLRSLIEGRRHI